MNIDKFSQLTGFTMAEATGRVGDDEIVFKSVCGRKFRLWHEQDCCEQVTVNDICGKMKDLIGNPILQAEENTSDGESELGRSTWTFYRIATIKGQVVIKWLGESNGFYSEAVSFEEVKY